MTENRRPIAARRTRWAVRAAAWLAGHGVRPNAISQMSMVFAAAGGALLAVAPEWGWVALLLAAAMAQGRLLCNLLDGMVAVEGGLREPDGPFWNEAPDRVSDMLLFCGAGVAAGQPALGLLVGGLSVGTAYVREMGRAEGFAPDFGGPFAKQQRMAVLTLGAVSAALLPWPSEEVLGVTLWILALGTALTAALRSARLIARLKARQ